MTRIGITALAMFLLIAPSASAARSYRDVETGVVVKVAPKKKQATVRFIEPGCGAGKLKTKVLDRRINRSVAVSCEDGAEEAVQTVRVTAKVTKRRVRGTVNDFPFTADRGMPPFSARDACGFRGLTVADSVDFRVYRDADATIACLRSTGESVTLAQSITEEGDEYSSGTRAWSIKIEGYRIAYAHAQFDDAASKYGQMQGAQFDPTVILRDNPSGPETRIAPELASVSAVALHPDGRVAWAGTETRGPRGEPGPGDVFVKTVQDGKVVTLDRGPIVAESLRAQGDGFAWDRR